LRRLVLPVLAALCLIVWSAAFLLYRIRAGADDIVLPTLMVLPSLTPTDTPPPTLTATHTLTPSPSPTDLPTDTPQPTPLPTLSARVLHFSAVMPGVVLPPQPTDLPYGLTLLHEPPHPVEPLPDATDSAPPFFGWYSFESDHPAVLYSPPWLPRLADAARRGQYHRIEGQGSAAFRFEGGALRVRYAAAPNMGQFDLFIDGVLVATIDAYAESLRFLTTDVFQVTGDFLHRLDMRATGRKHAASEGAVVGLDAIHVWRGDANTLILPVDPVTQTPSPSPRPARVELVGAPPTVQPTGTSVPPRVISAEVVIAYDENGNRAVDPAEGVAGISVRVVEVNTNRVIASGFTDDRGYVAFEVVTDAPAQIVVPYFGETWPLQRGGNSTSAPAYTLLLTPGNQPGLIP
jgi:hypothetical protein